MIPRVGTIHSYFGYPSRHSVCNDSIVQHLHDDFCSMISIAPLAFRPWDIPNRCQRAFSFCSDVPDLCGFSVFY